ncbi:MAG: hemolysin family protein [Propionibacteriaceae bacterium]|nr:hemolysin family protein [Propionibacteriaceae bacterium]
MALVSLREPQIKALSRRGKRGRAIADLAHNPNRFLSAVQIGVTLAGFLSASFGAATLTRDYMSPWLASWGLSVTAADVISLVFITLLISFFSIVLSELTAKRLAMQHPESFALVLSPLVNGIVKLFRPVIWLMGVCTNALVRLLGGDPNAGKEQVSDDELRSMVTSSETLGDEERHIVSDVFDAGSRSLREVMVPRTEAHFLEAGMPAAKALREIKDAPYSRYPVIDGSPDQVIGFLHVRDLADLETDLRSAPISQLARPVVTLPETVRVLRALSDMRRAHAHLAIVVDEYGGTAGIVTLEDLVEELIGDITDEYDLPADPIWRPGSGQLDGLTTIEEFAERTGYVLPEGPYDTLAGYFMAQLGTIAKVGDTITARLGAADDGEDGITLVLRVEALDGRRIERISIHTIDRTEPETK